MAPSRKLNSLKANIRKSHFCQARLAAPGDAMKSIFRSSFGVNFRSIHYDLIATDSSSLEDVDLLAAARYRKRLDYARRVFREELRET